MDLAGFETDDDAFEATLKTYIIYLERAFRDVRAIGGKTKGQIVVDLTGFSMSFLLHINKLKAITRTVTPNYVGEPSRLHLLHASGLLTRHPLSHSLFCVLHHGCIYHSQR